MYKEQNMINKTNRNRQLGKTWNTRGTKVNSGLNALLESPNWTAIDVMTEPHLEKLGFLLED